MDHGSTINYDIEEKQINLGLTLVLQEIMKYTEDLNFCELESLKETLMDNHREFISLFNFHSEELYKQLELMQQSSKAQLAPSQNTEPNMQEVAELAKKTSESKEK